MDSKQHYDAVSQYYTDMLQTSSDLKTTACSAGSKPHPVIQTILKRVPDAVTARFFGCGVPVPLGIKGLKVLDLGCGSGRDCYVASALVGQAGNVLGVDMTKALIQVAESGVEDYCKQLGYAEPNLRFVEGHIENLKAAGVQDSSVDLIISNCVLNLCPNKDQVFQEAYRVLKPGGEMYFSDMYTSRRLPSAARHDQVLLGEGITGAQYWSDFVCRAIAAGFWAPRLLMSSPITTTEHHILDLLQGTKLHSGTFRLFKLPGLLERFSEDYGLFATYKGNIDGYPDEYHLDSRHRFAVDTARKVSGNTAAMLGEGGISWLSPYFQVKGDRSEHLGAFEDGDASLSSIC